MKKRLQYKHIEAKHIIYFLIYLGMVVSLFLLYERFSPNSLKVCKFGKSFDCGIVSRSPYANIDGISYFLTMDLGLGIGLINISGINWLFGLVTSNAFLGLIALIIMMFLARSYFNKKSFLGIKKEKALAWLKGMIFFSVLYGLFLLAIQHFILRTYCIFCISMDIILVLLLVLVQRLE